MSGNGLVGPVYHDSAYTHDFADATTWQGGVNNSSWVLQPPPGFAFKLTGCETKTSENVMMHAPLHIWFQAKRKNGKFGPLPPVAGGGAAYLVSYANMKDWIKRGGGLPSIVSYPTNPEITKPIMLINFQFSQCPILWSSIGKESNGYPKWNRMVIKIADDVPYRDSQEAAIELALAKYTIEIFKEV